ncbi:MAG: methyltransferase domain-containing protein [Polyangiales bacterium]
MTVARLQHYADRYDDDYGYESRLVAARREVTLARLRSVGPARVVEGGCDRDPLRPYARARGALARWVIVEPTEAFARAASRALDDRSALVRGCLQDVVLRVIDALGGAADLVVMDSLLHELPDPDVILDAARRCLAPGGSIHVNVPNANSLHRRLAKAMGLIDDVRAMSARNVALAQSRVYDLDALLDTLRAAGFAPIAAGGHTVKPFTHAQMERVAEALGPGVFEGLAALGHEMPELAAEIHVDARRVD